MPKKNKYCVLVLLQWSHVSILKQQFLKVCFTLKAHEQSKVE